MHRHQQNWTALASFLLLIGLVLATFVARVPYVTWSPGTTTDVLGTRAGQPVLKIEGAPTYPTAGQLRMTSVAVTKPDAPLTLWEAVWAYLAPNDDVLPREAVYPMGRSDEQNKNVESKQLANSQDLAIIAALTEANVPITPMIQVTKVSASGPSNGRLEVGDRIMTANGVRVPKRSDLNALLDRARVGDVIELGIIRKGGELTVRVTTVPGVDNPQAVRIGIDTEDTYQHDVKVSYSLSSDAVGSSAGLIFALGIYDELTPGSLIDGRIVAGSGEIKASGEVSAIGGARQKLAAAKNAGAEIFLVPAANCVDVEPIEGITTVKVSKLSDAISSLELLKNPNGIDQVPKC